MTRQSKGRRGRLAHWFTLSRRLPEQRIARDAAEWFVRFRAGEFGAWKRRKCALWLQKSCHNRSALREIQLVHELVRLSRFQGSSSASELSNVIPLPRRSSLDEPPELTMEELTLAAREPWFNFTRVVAALAGVVFTVVLAIFVKAAYFDPATMTTEPGEWRRKELIDGSIVHVGPNTRLVTAFTDQQRRIVLSRGEALFEVASDRSRPFIVSTAVSEVQAVGTKFGVSYRHGSVVVTVVEGQVSVRESGRSDLQSGIALPGVPLNANQQVVVSDASDESVLAVDAARELQWADARIDVQGGLAAAADEFNRRNHLQIVIDDPWIAQLPVRLISFRLDDPEAFALYAAARGEVRVIREGRNVIRLERASAGQSAR